VFAISTRKGLQPRWAVDGLQDPFQCRTLSLRGIKGDWTRTAKSQGGGDYGGGRRKTQRPELYALAAGSEYSVPTLACNFLCQRRALATSSSVKG
jgi:hypothetical protein